MDKSVRPDLQAFYNRAAGKNLSPLWEVLPQLAPKEPRPHAVPFLWQYSEIRNFLFEASDLISAEDAERRVMILENPGFDAGHKITDSLYAGLQLIMPGEIAPAHRHAANALRFVIEGSGAFTAVDGERTLMHPGDFVITPGWTWHDHGNDTEEPMVWMDGLDVHIVNMLSTGFGEGYSEPTFPVNRPEGMSQIEHGYSLRPVTYVGNGSLNSPLFNYPYIRTREVLDKLARHTQLDAHHGAKVMYANPLTGSWAMPTIATWMQLLPAGFRTSPYRSTDGTVLVVVEGEGQSVVDGIKFDWAKHDVLVVPSWKSVEHYAKKDAVLFSFSDRAVQEKLGLWRERREPGLA